MRPSLALLAALAACADPGPQKTAPPGLELAPAPAPDDWAPAGPGGPAAAFSADQLLQPCAWLNGDDRSAQHHNLVVMHDGWLLFPWAPEYGGGGISFYDVSDPCAPVKVGEVWEDGMRETHTLATGRVGGREYLAVDWQVDEETGGIGFFDITDPTAPAWVSSLQLPGYQYPDAYFRVALSTTWVGDRLYVGAGLLGVFVVDVSDPTAPAILRQVAEPGHVVGTFHVVGDLGIASSAGLARFIVYDISDPDDWAVLSDQNVATPDDALESFYFSNVGGEYLLFARKDNGGGPILYSLADPAAPAFAGTLEAPDGDGGYVFRQGDRLFQGESEFGALYDMSDVAHITELGRVDIAGDLDTVTPIGNVAFVSVDEGGDPEQATGVFPWAEAPDADPPGLKLVRPPDGATWVAPGTAVGLSFDEMIEPASLHAGSVRVWDQAGQAVPGRLYSLEAVANFVPDTPLAADTTYWVEVPAGGVADVSGNPVAETTRFAFSTGAEVLAWPE